MKSFVFPYSISYGKLDGASGTVKCSLSDEDAKRLINSAKEGGRMKLSEDDFISDIFEKVNEAVYQEIEKELLDDPNIIRDSLSWDKSFDPSKAIGIDEVKKHIDQYPITAYYPEKLQLLTAAKSKIKMEAQYIITDKEHAEELIKLDNPQNNTIILLDEGKTLYYVPKKFAGVVRIPSSVRKIDAGYTKGAFYKRCKITEIIIEDGLELIPERAFSQCNQLKKIIIPSSVKKIEEFAFTGCSSLNKVIFSDGLEELHNTAFNFCLHLQELRFPSTLIEISQYITFYMAPLQDLYFYGMKTRIVDIIAEDDTWEKITMHVLPGSEAEKFAIEHNIHYEIM